MNSCRRCVWVSIGTIALSIILKLAEGQENVRIAILDKHGNGSGTLSMFHTVNGSRDVLAWDLSVSSNELFMGSHAPSGLICWLAEVNAEKFLEIHCYHGLTRKVSVTRLPQKIRSSHILSYRNFYMDVDVYGSTVYWWDPIVRTQIWATSITSKSSKVIAILSNLEGSSFLELDSYNGYFIRGNKPNKEVCSIKLTQTRTEEKCAEVPVQISTLVSGVATDHVRKMFYWSTWLTDFEVHSISYKEGKLADCKLVRGSNLTMDKRIYSAENTYLAYFSDRLYWLSFNRSVYSMDLESKTLRRITSIPTASSAISVFETTLPEYSNQCVQLRCSHLCLPDFNVGRRCACPSGLSLINGTTCLPPAILTWPGATTAFYLYYKVTPSSEEYKVCTIPPEKKIPVSSIEDPGGIHNCSRVEINDAINKFPLTTEYDIVIDPYGIGNFLTGGDGGNCIQFNTWATRITSTILCVKSIFAYAFDFDQSMVFWLHSLKSLSEVFLQGRKIGSKINKYNWPISNMNTGGLAVDSFRARLYWVSSFSYSLVTANYDGSDQLILPGTNNYFSIWGTHKLRFFEGHLLWHQFKNKHVNVSAAVAYDADVNVLKIIVPDPYDDMKVFYFIPAETSSHPCTTSNCSHTCVPHSSTTYACACPGPMILYEKTCKGLHLLVEHENSNVTKDAVTVTALTNVFIPYENLTTSNWKFSVMDSPENVIFTIRNHDSQVCWTIMSEGAVRCADHEKKIALVTAIHPNSTVLAFDWGNATYYNDGYAGNLTLVPLNKGYVYNFPTFPINEISDWAFDTWRNIFFWSNSSGIHFKVLHDANLEVGSLGFPDGVSVTAMTIDMFHRSMFYVQERDIKQISYKDLFARSDESVLLHSPHEFYGEIRHICHYEPYLFWLNAFNSKEHQIRYLNVLTLETELVSRALPGQSLASLLVLDPDEQLKKLGHPCQDSPCSHFCFLASPLQDFSFAFECYCPEGLTLIDDRRCEIVKSPVPEDITLFIVLTAVGGIVAMLCVVGLTVALIFKSKRNTQLAHIISEIRNGNSRAASSASNSAEKAQHLPLTCIIPPAELSVDETKVLGQGAFGLVLQGVYRNSIVAVKTLKPSSNLSQLTDFAKEVKMMHYIGRHPHILGFFGAEISNIKNRTFYAVLEFSPGGSLLKHLRKICPDAVNSRVTFQDAEDTQIELKDFEWTGKDSNYFPPSAQLDMMLSWAEQIACGMEFLTKKFIIHGDLAARNILVFDNGILKISDFGLSKQLYQYAHYKKKSKGPLPWRWMAIESLQFMEFSQKSDVWSYGVTLWEIFAFGQVPYPERQWNDEFLQSLRDGSILNKPITVPKDVYKSVMKPCWRIQPDQRPSFTEILDIIRGLIASQVQSVEYEIL